MAQMTGGILFPVVRWQLIRSPSGNTILPSAVALWRSGGMDSNRVVTVLRRRSRAEAERLASEFKQSGLRRKELCAADGADAVSQPSRHRAIDKLGRKLDASLCHRPSELSALGK